jgi:hypothetical protein
LFLTILASCSSGPKSAGRVDGEPAWIHQSARTVDGGYIVYVASSEDRSLDKAQLKAQSAAIQDIANECSFAPKGTRLEDRYESTAGILHRVYAKAAVSYQECEEAQKATEPGEIRKLANVAFTEQVKRYQDAIDEESNASDSDNEGLNPALASTSAPAGPIRDSMHFLVVRQQVAYAKELVILSPPSAYASGSQQAAQFAQAVKPAAVQVQNYQAQNPAMKSSAQSWSSLRSKPLVPRLAGVKGVRTSPPRVAGLSPLLTAPVHGQPSGYVNRSENPGKPHARKRRRMH